MSASVGRLHHLVDRVRARTVSEGRTVSALPGVWFFRYDRPRPALKVCSSSMYVGIALQGRKRVSVGALELTYHSLSYLVMGGETEYEASVIEATPARPYLSIGIELPPVREAFGARGGAPRRDEPVALRAPLRLQLGSEANR